jgi:hypothetical protein
MALLTSDRRRLLLAAALAVATLLAGARLTRDVLIHPNADIYTHLSVARHLAQGDGFQNDITYPVSFAFPFARQLPQPLIHRAPGYPVLLSPLVAASGGDATRSLDLARHLTLAVLGLLAFMTAVHLLRVARPIVLTAWLLTLGASSVWVAGVGRAEVEIICALLLTGIWLMLRPAISRDKSGASPNIYLLGLLCGGLCLMRGELFWLPLLWLSAAHRSLPRRSVLIIMTIALVMVLPWLLRNLFLTTNPFFTLQAHAEHLKFTADWPGYSIYQSLSPEGLIDTLKRDPWLVLHKTASGCKYYLLHPDRWLPWPMWILGLAALIRPGWRNRIVLPLLMVTTLLTMLSYAPFAPDERHLLILYPLLTLEIWRSFDKGVGGSSTNRSGYQWLALPLAAVMLWIWPAQMENFDRLDVQAQAMQDAMTTRLAEVAELPPGPLFTDSAELLWRSGRSGVWLQDNAIVEMELRTMMSELKSAPIIRAAPYSAAKEALPPDSVNN